MSIRAIYENGVFKPLEEVPIKEGTEVAVYPLGEHKKNGGRPKSVRELGFFGSGRTATTWPSCRHPLSPKQSDDFWTDLLKQVDWYREYAAPDIAEQFVDIVEATLNNLRRTPGLGRKRFTNWPELAGIRSFRVISASPRRG